MILTDERVAELTRGLRENTRFPNLCGRAAAALDALLAERAGLVAEVERLAPLNARLRQEAQGWAMEAKTHKSSLHEAYQACTGATGEPGNWHGAEPIKATLRALAASEEGAKT